MLLRKSIDTKTLPTEIENNWITSLKQYIVHGILPDDPTVAQNTRTSALRYVMVQNDLYRTIGDWPLLKCVSKDDGAYILREVHEGICRAHTGVSALISKVICYGYFWPTMREAAKEIVRACHKCQIHDNDHHVP